MYLYLIQPRAGEPFTGTHLYRLKYEPRTAPATKSLAAAVSTAAAGAGPGEASGVQVVETLFSSSLRATGLFERDF